MIVSEHLKSRFIEKMHPLQGPCGHLRPAPQRAGVISFRSYVATFGPHKGKRLSRLDPMWPPFAPTPKRRGAAIRSLCCHPGHRRSPHPSTPIGLTDLLSGECVTHQKGVSTHWDDNVAYSVNSSPDSKIPARPVRRHQHPWY